MFFHLIKDGNHLELIIDCICLYVDGGMCCNGSKCLKIGYFHIWLPHPPLVTRYDLTENHIVFDIYLNYYLLTIMLQHIKIRMKKGVL